jgi:DNA-binding GntR family transcriptional regulator
MQTSGRVGSRHVPLRAPVRDEICRQILDGTLSPGARLYEDQLASELGVSRNPVREALQSLAHEGFVDLEPRRGARVAVPDDERARHLFEVRLALEALVAELAATRRTDEQLAAIDAVVTEGQRALAADDMAPLPALNARYHSLLVDAAGNPLLSEILSGLIHQIQWLYTRRVRERAMWSWDEHVAIAAAIAARDRDLARRLATEHIGKARDAYFPRG